MEDLETIERLAKELIFNIEELKSGDESRADFIKELIADLYDYI